MESPFNYITEQYDAVLESRQVLLEYCKTISQPDLLIENNSFGRGGSIRNLLVHVANTYEFWIVKNALHRNISFTDYDSKQNIDDIINLFKSVNVFMKDFIVLFQLPGMQQIEYEINGKRGNVNQLRLFTHVITHEFHHKGQMLSISRHLGYIPVDTDIMR